MFYNRKPESNGLSGLGAPSRPGNKGVEGVPNAVIIPGIGVQTCTRDKKLMGVTVARCKGGHWYEGHLTLELLQPGWTVTNATKANAGLEEAIKAAGPDPTKQKDRLLAEVQKRIAKYGPQGVKTDVNLRWARGGSIQQPAPASSVKDAFDSASTTSQAMLDALREAARIKHQQAGGDPSVADPGKGTTQVDPQPTTGGGGGGGGGGNQNYSDGGMSTTTMLAAGGAVVALVGALVFLRKNRKK